MIYRLQISAGMFIGFIFAGILGSDWKFVGGCIFGSILTHIMCKVIEREFK